MNRSAKHGGIMGDELIALDDFIRQAVTRGVRNAYVHFEGFDSLYVRFGPRYVDGHRHDLTLDVANVTATTPDAGTFTRLIHHVDVYWPGVSVFVENVTSERFSGRLSREGWQRVGPDDGFPSFFRRAQPPWQRA